MEKGKPELRIGTSGWNYGDWRGIFYPDDLKSKDYLGWYARHFDTTEVNYSFYRLPRPTTYMNWSKQVPDNFCFSVKASRFITHIKRLDQVEAAWEQFLENASALGGKLGPVLLQFPPSFKIDEARLKGFLKVNRAMKEYKSVKLAFEFRHATWFDPRVLDLLQEHDAALVVAQSERYPTAPLAPAASFAYLRFHGPGQLFASKYSDKDLKEWSAHIKKWIAAGKAVYVYFNNDFHGHAIDNAKTLAKLARSN